MNKFWLGWFSAFMAQMIYQDMNGKELYLKKVNENWMNTDYYVWIIIWVIVFVVNIYGEIRK